jgi:hypothetical protein
LNAFALFADLSAGAFIVAFAAVFGICLQIDALVAARGFAIGANEFADTFDTSFSALTWIIAFTTMA